MRAICLFLIFCASTCFAKSLDLSVKAEAAILINAKTGKVLYEKNAHEQIFPASTTKIATALFLLHKMDGQLDQTVIAERESIASISPQAKKQSNYRSPAYWIETDSNHVGIKKGEEISYYDLLHMMLLPSANDAANVIAQGLSSSIPKCMEEMNSFLKTIGCQNTHFCNPHGLHHPDHYTTASDLALMAKEGLKNSTFRKIVSLTYFNTQQTNLVAERHLVQLNQLLKKGSFYYPKAIGVKTGTTQVAGKNLVAAAADNGRELIAVATGYKGSRSELYEDIKALFESAFQEKKRRRILLEQGEQPFKIKVNGARKHLKAYLTENFCYEFFPAEEAQCKLQINWCIPSLPISKGDIVGEVKAINEDHEMIAQAFLYASVDVQAALSHRIKNALFKDKTGRRGLFILGASFFFLILWRVKLRRA